MQSEVWPPACGSSELTAGPFSTHGSSRCNPGFSRVRRSAGSSAFPSPRGFRTAIFRKSRRMSALRQFSQPVTAFLAPATPVTFSDSKMRVMLAEEHGFMQIGEPLPSGITLKAVTDTLPAQVFELNDIKAWRSVAISVAAYASGLFILAKSPWYLLPLAWIWTGTAATGLFVIGHDCAHKSFSKNKLLEDIVGTISFLPLIYPYEPWRFKHDRHHAKTNMLSEDTAWHPIIREEYDSFSAPARAVLRLIMGPFRTWGSVAHWAKWHFNPNNFRSGEQARVKISIAFVLIFTATVWPWIIITTGIAGWFKFWLLPWLVYHFWMSTFTMVHHTAPHIPFREAENWNNAEAQLSGTVHCDYPKWVELLCHDINVHIPHHVSQRIPSYNLRSAHDSLRKNWGKYLNEAKWNWRLMKAIMTKCHIFDEEQYYVAFDDGCSRESKIIGFLRKFMPNTV